LVTHDLKKAGLKATIPRLKILETFEKSNGKHLSAEDVYKTFLDMGEDVGLATVYRVLTQFESAGLITKHNFEGEHSVYELNEGLHHDHILCVKCGRVDEFLDETIEDRQRAIAAKFGYAITDHCLYIYGICKDCQNQASELKPSL